MGKISLSYIYLSFCGTIAGLGVRCLSVWARVALPTNNERCSIVAGVFGSLAVLSGMGARMHFTWTDQISLSCHNLDGWTIYERLVGFGHLVSGYTSYVTASFPPRALQKVRAYIVTGYGLNRKLFLMSFLAPAMMLSQSPRPFPSRAHSPINPGVFLYEQWPRQCTNELMWRSS
jgi:hypothetical protein